MTRKNKRVTMEDVAREAGVSPMTVSRVINNTGRVSDETRDYIRAVIARMGYRPSRVARSLVTNQTYMIGVVVPDITNPFFAEILQGIEDVAWQRGYSVLLVNTSENPAREQAALEQLEETVVDGTVICSSRLPAESLVPLVARQRAVVIINRSVSGMQASVVRVEADTNARPRVAVQHLVQSGRRRIGYLCLHQHAFDAQQIFLSAIEEAGLCANLDWYSVCAPSWEDGYHCARQMLNLHPELDAMIGGNDLVALGILNAAKEQGRRVPEDLAIIGGDDTLLASQVTPPLTTFRVAKAEMGAAAARLLFKHIGGSTEVEEIVFPEQLIVRASAP